MSKCSNFNKNTFFLMQILTFIYKQNVLKEARKGFFVDVVFAKRFKITKKDI